MKIIKQTYHIHAPLEKVWRALIDPIWIEGWGGGPAEMNAKKGTDFTLWDGDIYGTNLEVVHGKKLVQEWFGGKWDKPSTVTFTLKKETPSITTLKLLHEDVPDQEVRSIEEGWKDYYLGPLKHFVEQE